MEIMLVNFLLQYCPSCGKRFAMGTYTRSDFLNGCTVSCDCGLRAQYIRNRDVLVEAADKAGGDLAESVRRYG